MPCAPLALVGVFTLWSMSKRPLILPSYEIFLIFCTNAWLLEIGVYLIGLFAFGDASFIISSGVYMSVRLRALLQASSKMVLGLCWRLVPAIIFCCLGGENGELLVSFSS